MKNKKNTFKKNNRFTSLLFGALLIAVFLPGLFLFSTEIGLSKTLVLPNNESILVAQVFKNIWSICALIMILLFMKLDPDEIKIPLFLLPFGILGLFFWPSIQNREDDGCYAIFWILFIWIFVHILRKSNQPYNISIFLVLFLIFDFVITNKFTQGGGIFHQHRSSGVLLLAILIAWYSKIIKQQNLPIIWRILLIIIAVAGIQSAIFVHQTRQMFLFSCAVFLASLINPRHFKKYCSKYVNVLTLLIIVLGFLPTLHNSGLFGNFVYDITSSLFSNKIRFSDAEAGREALFGDLLNFILANKISLFGPIKPAPIFIGGAVSSHNLWIESYLRYGFIYILGLFAIITGVIWASIKVAFFFGGSIRFVIPIIVINWLWILQLNDEGFIQTRAPMISLFIVVILAAYFEIKNQNFSKTLTRTSY